MKDHANRTGRPLSWPTRFYFSYLNFLTLVINYVHNLCVHMEMSWQSLGISVSRSLSLKACSAGHLNRIAWRDSFANMQIPLGKGWKTELMGLLRGFLYKVKFKKRDRERIRGTERDRETKSGTRTEILYVHHGTKGINASNCRSWI